MLATRRRAWWLLVTAILLGALSVAGLWARSMAFERSVGELVTTWSTTREIPAYTPITPDMMQARPVPRRYVSAGLALSQADVVGKVAAVTLKPGDTITAPMIRQPDLGDRRAITLAEKGKGVVLIDSTIQEGDRVDVLVAYRKGDQDVAEFLLRGVTVLKVTGPSDRSVSLLVLEDEARQVTWMENFGRQIRVVRLG